VTRQLRIADLRARLAQQADQGAELTSDYRIATEVGRTFLAASRDQAPTLLVPLSEAPAIPGRRGGGFSLKSAERVEFSHSGRRWVQPAATIECTDVAVLDAFLVLVLDIVDRIGPGPEPVQWRTVLEGVEEWQALFARRVPMTAEQQLGLWGELWFIAQSADADAVVSAWLGPSRAAVDFFSGGVGLEIKTSTRRHIHAVSLSQTSAPAGVHDTYLLSIWAGLDPQGGLSVAELADLIFARAADPSEFLRKLAAVGFVPADRTYYESRWRTLQIPLLVRTDDVPTVRGVDPGVSLVRYTVTLGGEPLVPGAVAASVWRKFDILDSSELLQ